MDSSETSLPIQPLPLDQFEDILLNFAAVGTANWFHLPSWAFVTVSLEVILGYRWEITSTTEEAVFDPCWRYVQLGHGFQ